MLLLGGCAASPGAPKLDVTRASLVQRGGATELDVAIMFQPSAVQLDALDHGVPLSLRLRVSGDGTAAPQTSRLVLRYFPLSRRYQLHTEPGGDRSFALRGYLLDALQRLTLPLAHDPCSGGGGCRVEVRFDYSALPGALRLPALIRPSWRVPDAHAALPVDAT